jgi:hypothetical protein
MTVRLIPKLSLRSKIPLAISGSPNEPDDPYRACIGRSVRKGPSFIGKDRPCSVLRFVGGGGGSGTSEAMSNRLRFSYTTEAPVATVGEICSDSACRKRSMVWCAANDCSAVVELATA